MLCRYIKNISGYVSFKIDTKWGHNTLCDRHRTTTAQLLSYKQLVQLIPALTQIMLFHQFVPLMQKKFDRQPFTDMAPYLSCIQMLWTRENKDGWQWILKLLLVGIKALTILEAGSVQRGSRNDLARVWPNWAEVRPSLDNSPTPNIHNLFTYTYVSQNKLQINVFTVIISRSKTSSSWVRWKCRFILSSLLTARRNFRLVASFSYVSLKLQQWRREQQLLLEPDPM